jgi:DNA-binding transcriptional LysR family regulator
MARNEGDMDWQDLKIFSAVAHERTLTDAGRRLGIAVATVARRIDALEIALGLRLFDRSPSGIALTTHGRALQARIPPAVSAIADIDRLAAALRAGAWPDPIRISATEPVVTDILAPALPGLFSRAPDIRLELAVQTEVVSLAAREADIAVRFARPTGDSLIMKRLPDIGFGLYAARSYLAGRRPADIEFKRERMLGYDMTYGRVAEVIWMEKAGLADVLAARTPSTRAVFAAVKAGAGIALLPRMMARGAAELTELPPPLPLPRRGAWLVWHRDLLRARPLRLVRDWIVDAFRGARTA